MPRVCQFNSISIYLYHGDHTPPHFHARAGGAEARVQIAGAVVMTSNLSPAQLRAVVDWAGQRELEL